MKTEAIAKTRVAILVFPFAAQHLFSWVSKVSHVVANVTQRTFVVSGGIPADLSWPEDVVIRDFGVRLHYLREKSPRWLSAIAWMSKAIIAQILLAREVFKLRHEIDVIFCSMGIYYQLPILMAKLLNKKVLSASMGLYARKAKISYGDTMAAITSLLTRQSFTLSDLVVVESFHLGTDKDLAPFHDKLCNGALFLEKPDHFKITTPITERKNLVGFIGRLVEEKGVRELLQAIPLILERKPDLQFLIVGTGILDKTLEETLQKQPWASHVSWIHWVEHDKIPDTMNRLKLLIVPSSDEGLPNIVLEAMGCGTPVLATAAGGIPDLIKDGETGFLLENSTPGTIAEAVLQAIQCPDLARLTEQAEALVRQTYTLECASQRYKAIMNRIMQDAKPTR